MTDLQIVNEYLTDLGLSNHPLDESFLAQLQSRHVAKHTFNSVSAVLKQPLPLDIAHLLTKITKKQFGGYCFEHNKLAFHVLKHLGFDVKLLLAKVVYNRDVEVPRTHRATLVTYQGEQYLFDVGFGPQGAIYPLKLMLDVPQPQGYMTYRITQNQAQDYCFQVLKNGEFFTLYTFDLNYYSEADCELSHFYSHKHPNAAFVNNLVVSRKTLDETHSLRNGEYHHITPSQTEITKIVSAEQLHQLLQVQFSLNLDEAVCAYLFSKFSQPTQAS
ncbi:arylamine N-acetyltransferase family protein [Pseudoalteromonas obscura]|uniref:Arylamine N-acetyltransferase n=1 Tax=Pseudoalteromonas obscura TaxID=3048491 RepID=A0ABT7ELJ3_9GAMM|nr:arylamine N-acetyltransferase [Pseudoalteromonas sp. P94(2023)]MDK2595929.1 arylamine N-acetyltransferase [Pseudoalteromonas sp. P94(2023)]